MQTAAFSVGIIGAGLAGCEAAITLARSGVDVVLYEMRPGVTTPAHKTALPAELVCSNSFKSNDLPSAQALLKKELVELTSPLFAIAAQCAGPGRKRACGRSEKILRTCRLRTARERFNSPAGAGIIRAAIPACNNDHRRGPARLATPHGMDRGEFFNRGPSFL